jgi:hypothetical protein
MPEPTTQAGQRLDLEWPGTHLDRLAWRDRILAIEHEAVEQERERLRDGLTYLWENGQEVGWLGPFCAEHHKATAECGCDTDDPDFQYEPTPPSDSTYYVGHQWLLRSAVLALFSSEAPKDSDALLRKEEA